MQLALCILAVIIASSQAVLPPLQQFMESCMQEQGLSEDEVPKPPQPGTPPTGPKPEPSQKIKCFLSCLMEKGEIVNSAGELQVDKIPLPPGVSGIDFDSCKSITSDDKCEKAWMMEKCIRKQFSRPN